MPGGIRTPNPSKRAAAYPRLRPRGHWAWRLSQMLFKNISLRCLCALSGHRMTLMMIECKGQDVPETKAS